MMRQVLEAYVLPVDEKSLYELFAAYDFSDEYGHPLLRCLPFQKLISEFCRLKKEEKRNVLPNDGD